MAQTVTDGGMEERTEVRMEGQTEEQLEKHTKVQTTYFQRGWLMKSLSRPAAFSHSAVGPQDCGFEGGALVLASHLKLKVAIATQEAKRSEMSQEHETAKH